MRFHFKSGHYEKMIPDTYYIDQINDKLKKEIVKMNKKYENTLKKKKEDNRKTNNKHKEHIRKIKEKVA